MYQGFPPMVYLVALLVPDVSMLGDLAGPRIGSLSYNAAHTYLGPLALAGIGIWVGIPTATLLALVWAAHIGVDRLLGYGLKYSTGFKHTHLGGEAPAGGSESVPGFEGTVES